jgi:hypothetical protein
MVTTADSAVLFIQYLRSRISPKSEFAFRDTMRDTYGPVVVALLPVRGGPDSYIFEHDAKRRGDPKEGPNGIR